MQNIKKQVHILFLLLISLLVVSESQARRLPVLCLNDQEISIADVLCLNDQGIFIDAGLGAGGIGTCVIKIGRSSRRNSKGLWGKIKNHPKKTIGLLAALTACGVAYWNGLRAGFCSDALGSGLVRCSAPNLETFIFTLGDVDVVVRCFADSTAKSRLQV